MLSRLFPSASNFTYTGSRVALWLLAAVLFVKLAVALGAVFNGHYAASVADGIPIDTFTPQGTQAFLSVFASLGLSQFILGLLGVVLLVKYRPLVPLLLLLLLVEHLARKGIQVGLPIARTGGEAGGAVQWALFAVMMWAFVLSLRPGRAPLPEGRNAHGPTH